MGKNRSFILLITRRIVNLNTPSLGCKHGNGDSLD